MKQITCIIIEDEIQARNLLDLYINKIDELICISKFESPKYALPFLNENEVDLIITDINMPDQLGIDFARTITNDTKLIFTTAYLDYALEAFEVQALDYLVKPITFSRFEKAIKKVINIVQLNRMNDQIIQNKSNYIFLRKNTTQYKIFLKDIIYLEADNDYVLYFTTQGKFMIKTSLKQALEELNSIHFIRVHKSYIINKRAITHVKGNTVRLNEHSIPIGRVYKSNLK